MTHPLKKPHFILTMAAAALAGLGAVTAAPSAASADTASLTPSADTYTDNSSGDTNHGTDAYIELRQLDDQLGDTDPTTYTPDVRNYEGYMRFDLSGIASVTSATLTLTQVPDGGSHNDTITTDRFALYGLNDAAGATPQNWDELALTYNSAGVDKQITTAPAGVVTSFDGLETISDLVAGDDNPAVVTVSGAALADWLTARAQAGGLATLIADFPASGTSNKHYQLGTRENSVAAYRPTLTLTYTPGTTPPPATPEPASLALLGLGGLMLLKRRNRQAIA